MLTKFLFTLLIFGAAILFIKKRQADENEESRPATQRVAPPRVISENERLFRQGAWLFLALMVISAIGVAVFKIGGRYATVDVRIINTRNGEVRHYRAPRDGIKSDRIVTDDGRTIFLADVERMEVESE